MDAIWNCAFGVDNDLQHNPDNPYFTRSESFFSGSVRFTIENYLGGN